MAVILHVGLILPILKTNQFRFENLLFQGRGGRVKIYFKALNAIIICFGNKGLIIWM